MQSTVGYVTAAMTDLNCYITTFNCGRTLIDTDYFAANFFNGIKSNLPPDLVVLSLQEIAPIAYSFSGGALLDQYFSRFVTALGNATTRQFEQESDYRTLLVQKVGMTALMVFARSRIEERIQWIETAGVGVGLWEMGNKGAVGARIGFEETAVTFVAAHLAPMEDAWRQRNQDWKTICQGLVFERDGSFASSKTKPDGSEEAEPLLRSPEAQHEGGEVHGLFSPISHIFFAGDLNYRTSDTPPKLDDHKIWPQTDESLSDVQNYSRMLEGDQLHRERSKGNTLNLLTESEITFPPTYKYSDSAQSKVAGILNAQVGDEVSLWAKHRVPSWCDRILFLESAPPEVQSYTALPVQPTSDHRPVVFSCSVALKPLAATAEAIKPPFRLRKDWREARAAAARLEVVVGFAAYLTLTWEGEALLAGTVVSIIGGYLALRALLGS